MTSRIRHQNPNTRLRGEAWLTSRQKIYIMQILHIRNHVIIGYQSPLMHSVVWFLWRQRRPIWYSLCPSLVLNCGSVTIGQRRGSDVRKYDYVLGVHTQTRTIRLHKPPQDVFRSFVNIRSGRVLREVFLQCYLYMKAIPMANVSVKWTVWRCRTNLWQLALEYIDLVQEQNDWCS